MRRRSVHFESTPRILVGERKFSGAETIPERGEAQDEDPSLQGETVEGGVALAQLGSNLKDVEPELRRSLTNLTFTPIEDPHEDLDVLRSKLVGRDELEIYRLKKMRQTSEANEETTSSSSSRRESS